MHLLRVLRQNRSNLIGSVRCLCDGKPKDDTNTPLDPMHPLVRTGRLLKRDMVRVKDFLVPDKRIITGNDDDIRDIRARANDQEFQTHCDVLVIGGGGVGSSIAYWLKKRARDGLNVVVLEKDPTVSHVEILLLVWCEIPFDSFSVVISIDQPQRHYRWVDFGNSFRWKRTYK